MHLPWPRAWLPLTEETCGANLSLSELHSRGQHSATILCFDPPTYTMAALLLSPPLSPPPRFPPRTSLIFKMCLRVSFCCFDMTKVLYTPSTLNQL